MVVVGMGARPNQELFVGQVDIADKPIGIMYYHIKRSFKAICLNSLVIMIYLYFHRLSIN